MAINPKRFLIGCGVGCLALILLLIASCVGFRTWLRAPGELLEPRAMLDPDAVGYLEGRLEEGNPGTDAMMSAMEELLRSQRAPIDSPVLEMFYRWNQSRQIRDLRRLLPARVVWVVYPREDESGAGETESVYSASIQRAAHQLRFADWITGVVFRFAKQVPTQRYRDERAVVIEEQRSSRARPESEAGGQQEQATVTVETGRERAPDGLQRRPFKGYFFMRGEGVFLATSEDAMRRTVDRMLDGAPPHPPGELDRLLAPLSEESQLRGAFSNRNGELLAFVRHLAADGAFDGPPPDSLVSILEDVDEATVEGGFSPEGDLKLEIALRAHGPMTGLEEGLDDLLQQPSESIPVHWRLERDEQGARVNVWIDDFVGWVRGKVEDLQRQQREIFEQRRRGAEREDTAEAEAEATTDNGSTAEAPAEAERSN